MNANSKLMVLLSMLKTVTSHLTMHLTILNLVRMSISIWLDHYWIYFSMMELLLVLPMVKLEVVRLSLCKVYRLML